MAGFALVTATAAHSCLCGAAIRQPNREVRRRFGSYYPKKQFFELS